MRMCSSLLLLPAGPYLHYSNYTSNTSFCIHVSRDPHLAALTEQRCALTADYDDDRARLRRCDKMGMSLSILVGASRAECCMLLGRIVELSDWATMW